MRLSLFCPLTLAALALAPPAAAQRTSLQIVVRDSSGLSIPFASAVVFPDGRIVGADQHGHIPISGLQVGLDTVMVRAIGFHPLLVPVRRISTPGFALTVTMARAPYVLPEVSVSSEESYDPIRAFHERARGSGGRFVARWQIARTGYIHASQTLQMVLGVRYEGYDPVTGGAVVRFPGCRDVGPKVSVFIDGRESAASPVSEEDVAWIMDLVAARDIEAIEVYRRRSEIPIRFRNEDACAAVLVWTQKISQ